MRSLHYLRCLSEYSGTTSCISRTKPMSSTYENGKSSITIISATRRSILLSFRFAKIPCLIFSSQCSFKVCCLIFTSPDGDVFSFPALLLLFFG